jgi:Flp pilus assembly protein CpaB
VVDPQLILNQGYQLSAKKGDILYSQFVEAPGIRNSVDAGMRAVSLSVNNQGMMSGLIMDGDYVDVVFKTRVDLLRVLDTSMNVQVAEDGPYQISGQTAPLNSDSTTDPQLIQGADGSNFVVTDAGQNLEPVAKIIVQDLKVIRVVPAGVTYDGQGQQVKSESDSGSNVTSDTTGQLILQASPDQAEVLSFIQDPNDSYEILVRGQDDHAIATTSGVTYQILMTDEQWALPWPKPIAAPGGSDKK